MRIFNEAGERAYQEWVQAFCKAPEGAVPVVGPVARRSIPRAGKSNFPSVRMSGSPDVLNKRPLRPIIGVTPSKPPLGRVTRPA